MIKRKLSSFTLVTPSVGNDFYVGLQKQSDGKYKNVRMPVTNGSTATRYTTRISQAGTANPTVTTPNENGIGTIVWTRISTGVYNGTLTGAFPSGKTYCWIESLDIIAYGFKRLDNNTVQISTGVGAGAGDDFLSDTGIKIEVYP